MSVDDFTAYFTQSRATTGSHELQAVTEQTNDSVPAIESGKHNRRSTAMMVVGQLAKEWLCPDDRALRRTKERVHFPLATIATFIIIAISLMLMVSGSVMVAGAKKQVSDLRREVNDLSAEAAVLEDKLEAGVDYFEVYRIATEEYGMVDAGYVSASYLNGDTENRLEAHAVQEDNTTGLATLLAAIGIRSGK
jgi:cell division protein FtsB